jgi:hypothetical protein
MAGRRRLKTELPEVLMAEPSIAVPPVPPPPDPLLTLARVSFHTNDDDKDNDTLVQVEVRLSDQRTVVAKLSDFLGHFPDHSDAGPFTLIMVQPVRRSQLRTGNVNILAFADTTCRRSATAIPGASTSRWISSSMTARICSRGLTVWR